MPLLTTLVMIQAKAALVVEVEATTSPTLPDLVLAVQSAGINIPATDLFIGDGATKEFICGVTPARVYVDGKRVTNWTATGAVLAFKVPPKGSIVAMGADALTVDDQGVIEITVSGFYGTMTAVVTSPLLLSIDNTTWHTSLQGLVENTTFKLKVPMNRADFGNVVTHELKLINISALEPSTVQVGDGVITADWTGVSGDRGFEFYAE